MSHSGSIEPHLATLVQQYTEKEFITQFRISPTLFWNLSEAYGDTNINGC